MKKTVFALLLFVLAACHPQRKMADKDQQTAQACRPMLTFSAEENLPASDWFNLDSLTITNNCLSVVVSYSGGCGDADFKLFATNKLMNSMPPQTVLLLHFTDNDPCREIVQDTLYFDLATLTPLAEESGLWLRFRDSKKKVLYKPDGH